MESREKTSEQVSKIFGHCQNHLNYTSYKNRNDRKSHLEFLRNGEIEVNKFREEELFVALKKFQYEGQDRWSTRFFLLKGHRP